MLDGKAQKRTLSATSLGSTPSGRRLGVCVAYVLDMDLDSIAVRIGVRDGNFEPAPSLGAPGFNLISLSSGTTRTRTLQY